MTNSLIIPKIGQHCAIFGQTGCGKTVLARRLVNTKNNVLVLDTKGETRWEDESPELGYIAVTTIDELYDRQSESPRIIFRPSYKDDKERFAEHNEFFKFAFIRRNNLVYVDEGFRVCKGNTIPFWWGRCLTEGRQLKISCYTSSQRPTSINQEIISEAAWIFSFCLQLPQDRQKIQECYAYSVEFLAEVEEFYFYQFAQARKGGIRGAFKLKI